MSETQSRVMTLEKAKHAYCDYCNEYTIVGPPVRAFHLDDFYDIAEEDAECVDADDVIAKIAELKADHNVCSKCGRLALVDERKPMEQTEYACLDCTAIYPTFSDAYKCCAPDG